MESTKLSSGELNEGGPSFCLTVDARLIKPSLFKQGAVGGTISSDQLWSFLRTERELEQALLIIKAGIIGWREHLKVHNSQPNALSRYDLKTGDPLP